MKRLLDIDQLLIFLLLAVTVGQMGTYLSRFAPEGFAFVGYLQAIAIDCAIWRSAYWFRRYTGRKQRRWSLVGVLGFSLVSAWYNRNYYAAVAPALGAVVPWLMGMVLPAGVALLSFLSAQKDESRFGAVKDDKQERQAEPEPAPAIAPAVETHAHRCEYCAREFAYPTRYADSRAAQNALAGHLRSHNGHRKEKVTA